MSSTSNLNLPYIMAAQAQKHVTHNEALRSLDAIVQIGVVDRNLAVPPTDPPDGERYIVAAGASGDWSGKAFQIAAYQDGAWAFYAPQEGWIVWVADEDVLLVWDGTVWVVAGGQSVNPAPLVGINATADATNKLAVKSDATLFSHDDVTPGSGDMRQVLNKAVPGNTVSQLYQTNYSGRAETGLTGDDDFHLKVSPNGATWHEAMKIDRNTGLVQFPNGVWHSASGQRPQTFVGTPGGQNENAIFRIDSLHSQNPRTDTIASISSDTITLTGSNADHFFTDAHMRDASMVRIWNTSKTPEQSAWVKSQPANNQLQVQNSADIASWLATETIQVGEPSTLNSGRVVALDISPMMTTLFGQVFRQTGIFAKTNQFGNQGALTTQQVGLGLSPTGASGSFINANSAPGGAALPGLLYVACTEPSPISNSNLVYFRENDAGIVDGISISLISSLGLLVEM